MIGLARRLAELERRLAPPPMPRPPKGLSPAQLEAIRRVSATFEAPPGWSALDAGRLHVERMIAAAYAARDRA